MTKYLRGPFPYSEDALSTLQQAIDAEIKSLGGIRRDTIRALKLRRNALSPISSLPPEVFAAYSPFVLTWYIITGWKPDHHLARLRVSHVCHQWREIALNQPLLWSHVDFTTLSLAGATEILVRAKSVPLYLEQVFLAVAGTMFDSVHSEKKSRRASPTYATLELAQNPPISTVHLKDLYHLLPLSNIFRSLPIGDMERRTVERPLFP
jgi:hypothetical protein